MESIHTVKYLNEQSLLPTKVIQICGMRHIYSVCVWRLKEMAGVLDKQHDLLKLIIQKMEITSEADEYDGPHNPRALRYPSASSCPKSKWVPLMQALRLRKWHQRQWFHAVLMTSLCMILDTFLWFVYVHSCLTGFFSAKSICVVYILCICVGHNVV